MTRALQRPPRAFWSPRNSTLIVIGILFTLAATLYAMGRIPICKCGYVKLWHGVVRSSENSQHLTDWYTPSHVIHGFAFYGVLWLIARRLPVGARLALATIVEAAWEVFENTDFTINRYRSVTISLDYYGDSIINSVCDVVAMTAGFVMAARFPVWVIVTMTVLLELLVASVIRDNLTLNILMLLYPLEAVRRWQSGG